MSQHTLDTILEFFYILIGIQLLYTAYRVLRDPNKEKRIGTALFWVLLAITFIFGPYIKRNQWCTYLVNGTININASGYYQKHCGRY